MNLRKVDPEQFKRFLEQQLAAHGIEPTDMKAGTLELISMVRSGKIVPWLNSHEDLAVLSTDIVVVHPFCRVDEKITLCLFEKSRELSDGTIIHCEQMDGIGKKVRADKIDLTTAEACLSEKIGRRIPQHKLEPGDIYGQYVIWPQDLPFLRPVHLLHPFKMELPIEFHSEYAYGISHERKRRKYFFDWREESSLLPQNLDL